MKTYALPVSIIILAASLLCAAFFYNAHLANGSVIMGGEYTAVDITSTTGTTSPKTRAGTLGSVVVDKVGSAGTINFYVASTTATSTATTTAALIFSFDGAADEGTYTFDIGFGGGGLLIEEKGYNGEAVVTYR